MFGLVEVKIHAQTSVKELVCSVELWELAEVGAQVELSELGKFEGMFSDVGELSEVAELSNLADRGKVT